MPMWTTHKQHPEPFMWTAMAESILAKLERLCKVLNGTQPATEPSKPDRLNPNAARARRADWNGFLCHATACVTARHIRKRNIRR